MKIINYINNLLSQGVITQDVADALLQYSIRLNNAGLPIIFNLRHIRKIFNITKDCQNNFFGKNRNEYHTFFIPKKNGDKRLIEAPSEKLRSIQKWINHNILSKVSISDSAKGFKKNNSIYDNAIEHVDKELVINIDLKNFFPNITYKQVFRLFAYLGYNNDVAHLLTQLCTNNKNVLPQGAPTSPTLSNIICLKLDKRLKTLCVKNNISYTRYADDMTFSGKKSIKYFLPTIRKIIVDEGFIINENKLRLQYNNERQMVTGLIVNKKISIVPELKKEIDNAIYYCKKYGVIDHMSKIQCDKSFYKEHLYGIAYFIKMIDKDKGLNYLNQLDSIEWCY